MPSAREPGTELLAVQVPPLMHVTLIAVTVLFPACPRATAALVPEASS